MNRFQNKCSNFLYRYPDKLADYSEQTLIPIQICKAITAGLSISFLNSNHFYNQVLMRTFTSFAKIYIYPRLRHFKKQGGPSAGSPFEQISMQRLTGAPSPISGGGGTVGSGWVGISKPPVSNTYLSENLLSFALG